MSQLSWITVIVINRQIAKNKPKYKQLDKYGRHGNYVVDSSNKRRTKYYKMQLKRRYKFQNVTKSFPYIIIKKGVTPSYF